jgi:hypothetical protein
LPKKTTEVIIKSKNHYIIAVKKNQKKLYEMLEMKRESCESIDQHISSDYSKGRQITRNKTSQLSEVLFLIFSESAAIILPQKLKE